MTIESWIPFGFSVKIETTINYSFFGLTVFRLFGLTSRIIPSPSFQDGAEVPTAGPGLHERRRSAGRQ